MCSPPRLSCVSGWLSRRLWHREGLPDRRAKRVRQLANATRWMATSGSLAMSGTEQGLAPGDGRQGIRSVANSMS